MTKQTNSTANPLNSSGSDTDLDPIDSLHHELDETSFDEELSVPLAVKDGEAVSGETPDPDSDDNVLDNMKEVGLHINEDDEDPQELDIAADIERTEQNRLGSSDIHDDSDL